MKRVLMVMVAFAVLFIPTFVISGIVVDTNAHHYDQTIIPSGSATLLSAVTATGAGTASDLGTIFSQSTCTVTWGGTAPTNTVVALEGSIDNSTFAALATVTVTATGTMWHTVNKPVRYVRGNYVSKSGGDGTTAVTLLCSFGGN